MYCTPLWRSFVIMDSRHNGLSSRSTEVHYKETWLYPAIMPTMIIWQASNCIRGWQVAAIDGRYSRVSGVYYDLLMYLCDMKWVCDGIVDGVTAQQSYYSTRHNSLHVTWPHIICLYRSSSDVIVVGGYFTFPHDQSHYWRHLTDKMIKYINIMFWQSHCE